MLVKIFISVGLFLFLFPVTLSGHVQHTNLTSGHAFSVSLSFHSLLFSTQSIFQERLKNFLNCSKLNSTAFNRNKPERNEKLFFSSRSSNLIFITFHQFVLLFSIHTFSSLLRRFRLNSISSDSVDIFSFSTSSSFFLLLSHKTNQRKRFFCFYTIGQKL